MKILKPITRMLMYVINLNVTIGLDRSIGITTTYLLGTVVFIHL